MFMSAKTGETRAWEGIVSTRVTNGSKGGDTVAVAISHRNARVIHSRLDVGPVVWVLFSHGDEIL